MSGEPLHVANEPFVNEALRLVAKADEQGIRLRILGSIAYRLHSPENIHLFAEMERALTDVDFAGSGLGLATVERIVRRHDGTVWAEGVPGEGAVIRFTLGRASGGEVAER